MDLNALLGSIASGPPPSVMGGVTRVPLAPSTLGMIGGVPGAPAGGYQPPVGAGITPAGGIPTPPGTAGGGVQDAITSALNRLLGIDPGQAPTPLQNQQAVKIATGGTGGRNLIGQGSTLQLAGPRDDRTLLANVPTPGGAMPGPAGAAAQARALLLGRGQAGGAAPQARPQMQQNPYPLGMLANPLAQYRR